METCPFISRTIDPKQNNKRKVDWVVLDGCSICLEEPASLEMLTTPGNHYFHPECINAWTEKSRCDNCLLCRQMALRRDDTSKLE